MEKFGKGLFGNRVNVQTEVTNGTCPICDEHTVFVSIFSQLYRCITCGSDTKQEINGHIRFMPITQAGIGKQSVIKLMEENGPKQN